MSFDDQAWLAVFVCVTSSSKALPTLKRIQELKFGLLHAVKGTFTEYQAITAGLQSPGFIVADARANSIIRLLCFREGECGR